MAKNEMNLKDPSSFDHLDDIKKGMDDFTDLEREVFILSCKWCKGMLTNPFPWNVYKDFIKEVREWRKSGGTSKEIKK